MPQYEVQSGDTLSAIAQQHQVTLAALKAENPRITDVDHIETGWTLKIPENNDSAATGLPEPKSANSRTSSQCTTTACRDEYAEIIHVMGAAEDAWCLALPEAAAEEIHAEIEEMDALMAEFKKAQDAPPSSDEEQPSPKRQWMIKATEKGVLAPEADDQEEAEPEKVSLISSKIAAIDEQIQWYDDYDPDYFFSFASDNEEKREDIVTIAKEQRLTMLRSQRQALQAQLDDGSATNGVKGNGIKASDFSKRSNQTEAGIIEIMVFSRPGRWYYVRKGVYQRITAAYASIRYVRKTKAIAGVLENPSATAGELIGKIKDGIAADAAKSPIGNVEVKFVEAKDEFFLLGKEHSKLTWNSSEGDNPSENTFQVTAEAQLMRFAMQASAGVNSFDLSTGEIDIGAKASASMALAEAEAKLAEVFVPNETGWDCRFTFRNRNGELTDLAFGAFRLSGDVTLNCFVGGRISGEANAKLSTGAATFLLSDQKKIKPDPQAGLSVSGNAFAGAEAGGAVSGKFCWVHPDEQYKSNANWQELLKIEAGGTVAAGVGAGMDFALKLGRDYAIIMACKGRLVFGPGASGSFGTTVDLQSCWSLCKAVLDALREFDYSYLENIDSELFMVWSRNLYLSLVNETGKAVEWINQPVRNLQRAWDRRRSLKENAQTLAQNIRNGRLSDILQSDQGSITLYNLPPETVGMLCHTLLQTFIESWEEEQERALIYIFSHIATWRKFFEVLQHMTEDGSKTNPMQSLEKVCAILDDGFASDDNQLKQFYDWISSELGATSDAPVSQAAAWMPVAAGKKRRRIREKLVAYNQKYGDLSAIV
ncbi:LysM domain-containing protein [Marinobacter sp. NFXS9]|uniref:LysM domain-containing protein n=1 Tax=Marinobacter sp. NFXS9 TaxID=2818433 RepID=UPI0032E00FEF